MIIIDNNNYFNYKERNYYNCKAIETNNFFELEKKKRRKLRMR